MQTEAAMGICCFIAVLQQPIACWLATLFQEEFWSRKQYLILLLYTKMF